MRIKTILLAISSVFSTSVFADTESVEIQKAIQLLEQKGYQIDKLSEPKKASNPGISIKSSQTGVVDAFISGDIGRTRSKLNYFDSYNNTVNDSSYNLRGSFAYQDPSKLGVQFDALYSQDNIKNSKLTTIDLAGHGFYRNDKFLLGFFGQYKQPKLRNKDISADAYSSVFSSDQVFFGGEAQGYFGDFTLTGQLARQEFINQPSYTDVSGNILFKHGNVATLKANYFLNDNWKVTAGYSYNSVDMKYDYGLNNSNDTHKFSLSTEYRLAKYPISFYGDFIHNKFNFSYPCSSDCTNISSNLKTDALFVGIKYNFGLDSLKERDRSGASLDPISNKGFTDWIGNWLSDINVL